MKETWIDKLQVGDKVIVLSNRSEKVSTVERITPTRRIVVGGITFDKHGSIYGRSYSYAWLREASESEINRIQRESKIKAVMSLIGKINQITYEQAVEIEKILAAPQEVNHE